MANVFDYLTWRGDLRFEQDGFNEVDNLIFSCLAYIDYAGLVPQNSCEGTLPLGQIAEKMKKPPAQTEKNRLLPRYPSLFETAAKTTRFKDVGLTCYANVLDGSKPTQFAAVTFTFSKARHYIAFRGTDDNLAGWKEDFLMAYKDVVPAQKQAVDYVNFVMPHLKGQVCIGGHSKGGNLAVYSAANAAAKHQRRIAAVYNNDGPGFQSSVTGNRGYRKIAGLLTTFIPQSSIVGMLLEHEEEFNIIASSERSLLSHNPLTWTVEGRQFIRECSLSKSTLQISQALRTWLNGLSLQEREQFVEALFDVISASGAQNFTDLSKEGLAAIDAMIRKLRSMDKETRRVLRDTIIDFFTVRQRIMRKSLSQSVESLLAKKS